MDKLIESFGDQNIQSKEMDEIIETYKLSVTKLDQEVKQYKELLDEKDIELTEVEKQKMGYLTEVEITLFVSLSSLNFVFSDGQIVRCCASVLHVIKKYICSLF